MVKQQNRAKNKLVIFQHELLSLNQGNKMIFNCCNFFLESSVWSTVKTIQFCNYYFKAQIALTNKNKVLA
jgi:hypothetical protein